MCLFSTEILLLMGFIAAIALPAAADTFSGYDVNLVTNAVVLGNGDLQLTAGMGEPDPAGHSGDKEPRG